MFAYPHDLCAVVLAAPTSGDGGTPFVPALEPLGGRRVIDYVLDRAREHVPAERVVIVVGQEPALFEDHLRDRYRLVVQDRQRGTGDAVLAAREVLEKVEGDVLVLYGDTPLLSPTAVAGLLHRHALERATMTFLTASVSGSTMHGRVVRSADNRVVDIVEHHAAPAEVRHLDEVNAGAYVAKVGPLLGALEDVARGAQGAVHLTDAVHALTRGGQRVVTHRTLDPDDAVGVDCPEDLPHAEFILEKRSMRPLVFEDDHGIRFGTGGWRAIIGESFTFDNLRRLSQALADHVVRSDGADRGVLIGYDRRFLSDRAAGVAAEVFAGNGVRAAVFSDPSPTPVVTFATVLHGAMLGLVITASHNPAEWNGVKVFREDGALLLDEETHAIQEEANALAFDDVVKIDLDLALSAGMIEYVDYANQYIDAVEDQIDMAAIRQAGLRVIIDLMYGSGTPTLETLLTDARCRISTLHSGRDPLFGGRSPAPEASALSRLLHAVEESRTHPRRRFDLGMAMDGDADRIAMVSEEGRFVHVNEVLLLLYTFLHEVRGLKGGVVRNIATTHMLDRLAADCGERCVETPVGFKHIVAAMQEHGALLGGESSGGLTIAGHILGKDGILAAMLLVEMLATTGKRVSVLLEETYARIGRLYSVEESIPATPAMKALIPRRLRDNAPDTISGLDVVRATSFDGTKWVLEDDSWLLLRFSGTEPLLRVVAEAGSEQRAQELVVWARDFVARQEPP